MLVLSSDHSKIYTNEFLVFSKNLLISQLKTWDILGELLKVTVQGEKNTSAVVQINTSTGRSYRLTGNVDGGGNYFNNNLIGKLICGGVSYTISVNLVDKAGNIGFVSSVSGVSTLDCPVCGESSGLFEKPIHNDKAYIAYVYGYSQKYFGGEKFHHGVDYNGVSRGEAIYSVAIGKMIEVRDSVTCENCESFGYGNYVKIDHGNGVVSVYAHLQSVKVKKNDIVVTNSQIGTMGSSGYSTGPHLHFGVEKNGYLQDPKNYLGKETSNLNDSQFAAYCKKGGTGDGTSDSPWGGKTADDLGKPKVVVKKDHNGKVTTELSPTPKITYIDSQKFSSKNEVVAYGFSIYKHQAYKYEYWEEPCKGFLGSRICIFSGWEWEKKKDEDRTFNNASVETNKEGEISWNNRLTQFWNDTPSDGRYGYKDYDGNVLKSGKWLTNGILPGESAPIRLGSNVGVEKKVNLNYGDRICIKAKIYEELDEGVNSIEANGDCKEIIDQNTIILDVPIIREDICEYNNVTLYSNYTYMDNYGKTQNCGYLCGYNRPVTGCHVIAFAMIHSYFRNKKQPVDINNFNKIAERYNEGGTNNCELRYYSKSNSYPGPSQIYKLYASKDEGEPSNYYNKFYLKSSNDIDFNVEYSKSTSRNTIQTSIDNSLKTGRPVILQIIYGPSRTAHAFPIVGKKNGQYLINDSFYGGGQRFTTLNATVDKLLGGEGASGQSNYVIFNQLFFFYNENVPSQPFILN